MQSELPSSSTVGTTNSSFTTTSSTSTDQATIDRIRTLCHQWCGVFLDQSKTYLIRNRLKDLMQELEIDNLERLATMAERSSGIAIRDRIVDALTTHETLFFRDRTPFEAIKKVILPKIQAAHGKSRPKLRIWSAACSTGQEPYSIAMAILESGIDRNEWNISIEATDVSSGSVKIAQQGIYAEHELTRGLTPAQRDRFFKPVDHGWQIDNEIRRMVRFSVGNLLSASQPREQFDLILCRNVAIYFTAEDRLRVFEGLSKRLTPDGFLFVGCSEVLTNINHVLKTETVGRSTCYRRVESHPLGVSPSALSSRPVAATSRLAPSPFKFESKSGLPPLRS